MIVGIIDSGVNIEHAAFAGGLKSEEDIALLRIMMVEFVRIRIFTTRLDMEQVSAGLSINTFLMLNL